MDILAGQTGSAATQLQGLATENDGSLAKPGQACFSVDPRWNEVRICHALGHTMGIDQGIMDVDVQNTNEYGTEDFLEYVLSCPPVYAAGEVRQYSDVAHYLLSRVVSSLTGRPADEFIAEHISRPLHFQPMGWFRCPLGHTIGGTGAVTRAEDVVKLAELCRQRGMYEEKRIVGADWIDLCEREQYDLYPVEETSFIGKGGMYGQMMMYSREKEMSVAWLGFNEDKDMEPLCRFMEEM